MRKRKKNSKGYATTSYKGEKLYTPFIMLNGESYYFGRFIYEEQARNVYLSALKIVDDTIPNEEKHHKLIKLKIEIHSKPCAELKIKKKQKKMDKLKIEIERLKIEIDQLKIPVLKGKE